MVSGDNVYRRERPKTRRVYIAHVREGNTVRKLAFNNDIESECSAEASIHHGRNDGTSKSASRQSNT
jgi:hypothetical protein